MGIPIVDNMENYSLTQTGNVAALAGLVTLIANHFGWRIASAEVESLIGAAIVLVGIVASWIGRYRVGDLTIGGSRKPRFDQVAERF